MDDQLPDCGSRLLSSSNVCVIHVTVYHAVHAHATADHYRMIMWLLTNDLTVAEVSSGLHRSCNMCDSFNCLPCGSCTCDCRSLLNDYVCEWWSIPDCGWSLLSLLTSSSNMCDSCNCLLCSTCTCNCRSLQNDYVSDGQYLTVAEVSSAWWPGPAAAGPDSAAPQSPCQALHPELKGSRHDSVLEHVTAMISARTLSPKYITLTICLEWMSVLFHPNLL